MLRESLASKALVSAGYDPDSQQLEIEFRSGRVYRYQGVPASVFEFLKRTRSKGAFVSRMIDGRYPHEEVTEALPEQDLLLALRASLGPEPQLDPQES